MMVRAGGVDVLVDPGTYDYFSFPEWRRYFRSTRAHNTLALDGADQSSQLGLFLWGHRAVARCIDWRPRPGGGIVAGEHDGYRALPVPATHRRTLDLDRATRTLTIADDVLSEGAHDLELSFHFSEQCDATLDGHRVAVAFPGGWAVLRFDERLVVTLSKGGEIGQGGWVSRGYHRKAPAWTARGTLRASTNVTIHTRLQFGELK
jgi:hypothetical protein